MGNNEQLIEAAKQHHIEYHAPRYSGDKHISFDEKAAFAAEQIAAERVRIADELERITNGSSCEINLLIQELREAK